MGDQDKVYGYLIDRAAKAVKADIKRRFKNLKVDLTPEQWLLLDKLKDVEGLAQVELGGSTYKDAPTVSRIIDLLCKKGYAERKSYPDDRRKFKIYITYKGREVLVKARPAILESRAAGWNGLSHDDYDHLVRIANKIFSNLMPEGEG